MTLFDKVGMIPAVSLIVPSGAEMQRLGGIDSSRAEIVMAGLRIEADYGRTGGTQSCDNIPDCVDKTARLDGHAAAWVRFPAMLKEDGAFSERLVFAIRARPEENPAIEPPMYLMLHAQCAAITHCDLAEEIALTAIFD